MRLLFVSPRYGAEVGGGAERVVREMSMRLARRGHEVHVVTTCSLSYVDWSNLLPAGESEERGVTIHRFPVDHAPVRIDWQGSPLRSYRMRATWRLPGYPVAGLGEWLQRHSITFDAVIAYTYQHHTTWDAVMLARAPVVLHPAAHPEPTLGISAFTTLFDRAAAVAAHTPEERDLIIDMFGLPATRVHVAGMGVEVTRARPSSVDSFRAEHGLGDAPYAVCVGRIDRAKGVLDLVANFAAFKRRHPGPLRLVLVGEPVEPIPERPDVVATGFVPDAVRNAAVAGALALIQPSRYESFSLVLAEGWLLGVPALVQGASAVLRGQVARSGGGLVYASDEEFDTGLRRLIDDSSLRHRLGHAGRAYAKSQLGWASFLDRYETLLAGLAGTPRLQPSSMASSGAPAG